MNMLQHFADNPEMYSINGTLLGCIYEQYKAITDGAEFVGMSEHKCDQIKDNQRIEVKTTWMPMKENGRMQYQHIYQKKGGFDVLHLYDGYNHRAADIPHDVVFNQMKFNKAGAVKISSSYNPDVRKLERVNTEIFLKYEVPVNLL